MFSRWKKSCPLLLSLSLFATGITPAQNAESQVSIWRGEMMNLLTDPVALLRFSAGTKGKAGKLRAPIAVHFPGGEVSYCWDAVACRLIYVWKGKEFLKEEPVSGLSSPAVDPIFMASGPQLFSATIGAYGKPSYFGFKLADGIPEFYYSSGRIGVRERITISEDGKVLMQHFAIENAPGNVQLVLPEDWKDRLTVGKGTTVKGRFLTLSKSEAADFTLSYSLNSSPDETSAPE